MINRDIIIDYLRFIGLSLIVLAHISAPNSLHQFRCFDVPLMIFITGLTTSRKVNSDYRNYICKRSMRLLVPVYIFLTLFFVSLFIIQLICDISINCLNRRDIINSYLLLEGIGYVWVIRVFLLLGFITPLIVRFEKFCKNDFIYGSVCIIISLINDLFLYIHITPLPGGKFVNIFFTEFIMFLIGYTPLFMLGLRLRYANKNKILKYTCSTFLYLLLILFIYIMKYGFPILITPNYKYPPQVYFIIYGAAASVILWLIKNVINKVIICMRLSSLATFIGQNSIWIYLWHIPLVLFMSPYIENWFARYIAVFGFAIFIF